MKHFKASFWKAAQAPLQTLDSVMDGFAKMRETRDEPNAQAISYTLKPGFVRSFATSGYPFLTFYEFNDLTGWCRDTYFAPDNVAGYKDDIGKSYTIWTHDAVCAYRRHIILNALTNNVEVSFEIPFLDAKSWFPLRIRLYDRDGLYFQTDQKLVVERIDENGSGITSWKKVRQLAENLPRLHLQTTGKI